MEIKYNINIKNEAIKENLKRLTNQIYKLLPTREEDADWTKPLSTIIEELTGMSELFLDYHEIFFSLLCKLEGLFYLKNEDDFLFFRKTIFECLNLISELGGLVCH
jgi:hypothetical protein